MAILLSGKSVSRCEASGLFRRRCTTRIIKGIKSSIPQISRVTASVQKAEIQSVCTFLLIRCRHFAIFRRILKINCDVRPLP